MNDDTPPLTAAAKSGLAVAATLLGLIITGIIMIFAVSVEVGIAFLVPTIVIFTASQVFSRTFEDSDWREYDCPTTEPTLLDPTTFDGRLRAASRGTEDLTE